MEITLFKSVGIALEDVALAKMVYDIAVGKGLGQGISF
jgi:ornithine cyclodeaminase/alanine dehydrogenase-like protein (mu-crystallin family)